MKGHKVIKRVVDVIYKKIKGKKVRKKKKWISHRKPSTSILLAKHGVCCLYDQKIINTSHDQGYR